jgi:hypothetical protein
MGEFVLMMRGSTQIHDILTRLNPSFGANLEKIIALAKRLIVILESKFNRDLVLEMEGQWPTAFPVL